MALDSFRVLWKRFLYYGTAGSLATSQIDDLFLSFSNIDENVRDGGVARAKNDKLLIRTHTQTLALHTRPFFVCFVQSAKQTFDVLVFLSVSARNYSLFATRERSEKIKHIKTRGISRLAFVFRRARGLWRVPYTNTHIRSVGSIRFDPRSVQKTCNKRGLFNIYKKERERDGGGSNRIEKDRLLGLHTTTGKIAVLFDRFTFV